MSSEALKRAARIRENISHVARGCRSASSHNPAPYLNSIESALVALLAQFARLEQERNEAERESSAQMSAKLEAQMALAAITEGLDLRLADLGNGWTEGAVKILARIETIVDEGERGFAALAVAREREQPIREAARALADAVTDFCMNDAPAEWDGGDLGYTVGGLASLADDVRAALVDEPAAAEPQAAGAIHDAFTEWLESRAAARLAADEPMRGGIVHTPTKRALGVDAPDFGDPIGDAAADEPGETPT